MSCTMYLICKSHDPVITSGEVGHNKSYLKQIREDISNREEIVEFLDKSMEITGDIPDGSVPQRSTWSFLWAHRNCELGIIDEYRHEYPIVVNESSDLPTIEDFIRARLAEIAKISVDATTRTSAKIAMKRMIQNHLDILDWHKNWPVFVETVPEYKLDLTSRSTDEVRMKMTQQINWLTQEEYRKRFGTQPPTAPLLMKLATTLGSTHPDFNEEWRA